MGELLAKGKGRQGRDERVVWPLCGKGPDNWAHMLLACQHEDVKEYYTTRHNAAGRKLKGYMQDGKMERWLMLTNFGRIYGNPEETTIPK
eukprot:366665-Prorocentrum_minimum.AAC.3